MPDKKQGNAEVLHQDNPLTFGEREARDEEPAKEAGSSLCCHGLKRGFTLQARWQGLCSACD